MRTRRDSPPFRATWSRRLLLVTLACLATPARGSEELRKSFDQADRVAPRPNFVILLADDLGYGNVGAYGQGLIATPHLDAMASEGLRFTRFYSGDSWCPAARNTLLTGLHTGHTQLRGLGVLFEDSPEAPLYLPRLLQNHGYATGMFGKWGLGRHEPSGESSNEATAGRPSEIGFDAFLGQLNHRDAHTFTLPPYPQEPDDSRIHDRLWTIVAGTTVEHPVAEIPYTEDVILAEAVEFMNAHREVPFFLYLPLALPHAEYYLPADESAWLRYLDTDGISIFPETPWAGNRGFRRPVAQPRATFAAMVTRMDAQVGLVLAELDRLGLSETTIVIFVSDNGPAEDGGFESPRFFASTSGLRGFKLSLYEGGIRVPMIVRWPGTLLPAVVETPMAMWDLFPTILELAGIDLPGEVDGLSMVPLFMGREDLQPLHDTDRPLYWETFNWIFESQAAQLEGWKAVRREIVDSDDRLELYDLERDPLEQFDRSTDRALCSTLLALKALMNASHVPPPGGSKRFDIPPLDPTCPLFADSFESGDSSAWRAP